MSARRDPRPTISALLRIGAERLAAAGIDNPRLETRLLLAHATGLSQEALLRDRDNPCDPGGFTALIARRAGHVPLAHILGWREFWSLRFAVSAETLIPRPDSETVVAAALDARPDPRTVLDLGTGTGCLLLALLHEQPDAWGVGVDRSGPAAAQAARNARALGLADRGAFICGDWTTPLDARFDLVVSNPPYIPSADIGGLMPEVAAHEPRLALDGGADGLDAYRRLVRLLPEALTADGVAVLEIGAGQRDAVTALAAPKFRVESRPDLSGTVRALILHPSP